MNKRVGDRKTEGFTIVELLIVVVVIAILAAITIVSYNGIQNRANDSAAKSEVSQNAKTIANAATITGGAFSTATVMSGGATKLNYSADKYKVVTYCTNGVEFVLAAQTQNGNDYYSQSSNIAAVNDNSIDAFAPCQSLSMSGDITTTYTNLPGSCAGEAGTCTFSGTATVVYGNTVQGKFARLLNATSPVTCKHGTAYFSADPAPGIAKACYVYPN